MQSIKFLILATLLPTPVLARDVEILIAPGKPIRTIWVPPNEPKILIFPGDVSYCYNSTRFLRTATADALKLEGDANWIREMAVATNLSSVTPENVEDVASAEYILRCKFQGKDGNYINARIPVRIDSNNKFKDEETYVFSESGKSLLDRSLKERIKSYGQMEIKGDKLIIPTFAQEKSSPPKSEPEKVKPDSKAPEQIKGFKSISIGS